MGIVGDVGEADGHGSVPELLLHERDRRRIGEVAAEDDDVRLLAANGGAPVVAPRPDRGLDALALEEGIEPDRGLDVLEGEENFQRWTVVGGRWSVIAPVRIWTAWSMIGSSAPRASRTPLGEPGRFTM